MNAVALQESFFVFPVSHSQKTFSSLIRFFPQSIKEETGLAWFRLKSKFQGV